MTSTSISFLLSAISCDSFHPDALTMQFTVCVKTPPPSSFIIGVPYFFLRYHRYCMVVFFVSLSEPVESDNECVCPLFFMCVSTTG